MPIHGPHSGSGLQGHQEVAFPEHGQVLCDVVPEKKEISKKQPVILAEKHQMFG